MTDIADRLRAALADRYAVERELGAGGMATVYLAQDLKHDRPVAVKVLHPELASALGSDRFLREIAIAASLNHPHLLPLHDSGESGGFLYYVMPFIEGESLRERISRQRQLPLEDALQITREVADALGYAHERGVIHRDVKPENILFQGGHAVLADFGIALAVTAAGRRRLTESGIAVGTAAYMSPEQASGTGYMSPEQASGTGTLDGRSDQYSLACVLYEMLAGDPPFTGPTAQAVIARKLAAPQPSVSVVRDVPRFLEAALNRAMARSPADRFRTMADFAAALQAPQRGIAGPARPWSTRRRVLTAAAALVTLGAVIAVAAPVIRGAFRRVSATHYPDAPAWSGWRGWTGEDFSIFAVADSVLLVGRLGTHRLEAFDGERWTSLAVPDSFDLLSYEGRLAGRRLLATRTATSSSGQALHQYWWMSLSPGGIAPQQQLTGPIADEGRHHWWTDGRDVVTWLGTVQRMRSGAWVREPTGTSSGIQSMWGNDVNHRFALGLGEDSLLVFDGISWKAADILGGRRAGRPTLEDGSSFPDGATVVVGEECAASERCRPMVLEQRAFEGAWRRVRIPSGVGLPARFPPATAKLCDPGQLSLEGVNGTGMGDYVFWGAWVTCDDGPMVRHAAGCPPRQPCVWQVRDGRVEPAEDLVGRVVWAVAVLRGTAYALLDDGTLWRRVGLHWRAVTKVPRLPARLVAASPQIQVRAVGGALHYEPGRADSVSPYFTNPAIGVPEGVSDSMPARQVMARDSTAALLTAAGDVYVSRCGMARGFGGGPRMMRSCPVWRRLPSAPGHVAAIAFLADGRIVGVGAHGLAVTWGAGAPVREELPAAARADSMWSVAASPDGHATAIGVRTVVDRDSAGHWSVARTLNLQGVAHTLFAALPGGDLVVAGRTVQVWDRSRDTLPVATVYLRGVGEPAPSALHALPDGRLVAGLSNPAEPTLGGQLVVWAAPARANRSQRVDLPLSLDITDLSDDGRYLWVSGRGGTVAVRLDSLPFAPALRRPQSGGTVAHNSR